MSDVSSKRVDDGYDEARARQLMFDAANAECFLSFEQALAWVRLGYNDGASRNHLPETKDKP